MIITAVKVFLFYALWDVLGMLVLGQKKIQRINDKCVARTGPITSTIFMIVYHYSVSMWWPNSGMGLFSQSPLLRCGLFFQSHPNIGYPWISSSYSTSVNLAAEIPDQYESDSKDHGLYFYKIAHMKASLESVSTGMSVQTWLVLSGRWPENGTVSILFVSSFVVCTFASDRNK